VLGPQKAEGASLFLACGEAWIKSRDEQGGPTMIVRLWRGWTTAANADA
jgi:hypothetical protein